MKRLFDTILILFSLPIFGPILVIIAILVRIKLGSPILFCQQRPGLNGKSFHIYKFRTMTDSRDQNGDPLPDHIRLTDFGKFLRSTSLDELPELFNVVKGEMSLVGPRPLLMQYLPLYSEEQSRRHDVRPGITGWAQINGRNLLSWDDKFRLDIWYVSNHSIWLDIKILLLTIKTIFKHDGITHHDECTWFPFMGSVNPPDSIKRASSNHKEK